MMLSRPLIDSGMRHSLDLPFHICQYHWSILHNSYRRYLINLQEAESQARLIANSCPQCETPGRS